MFTNIIPLLLLFWFLHFSMSNFRKSENVCYIEVSWFWKTEKLHNEGESVPENLIKEPFFFKFMNDFVLYVVYHCMEDNHSIYLLLVSFVCSSFFLPAFLHSFPLSHTKFLSFFFQGFLSFTFLKLHDVWHKLVFSLIFFHSETTYMWLTLDFNRIICACVVSFR